MQQLTCKMVWFFSINSLLKKTLILRNPGGKILKKSEKTVEKCEKVPKHFAL